MNVSKLVCDFNDGTPCTELADNVGVDETDRKCLAIVCEHHACVLASDAHTRHLIWFKLEGKSEVANAVFAREAVSAEQPRAAFIDLDDAEA